MMRKVTIQQTSAFRRIATISCHLSKPLNNTPSLKSNFTSSVQNKLPKSHHWTQKDFKYSTKIQTRWMDNDIYGHVNNVVYYSYFDTVVNRFLIEKGDLKIHESKHKTADENHAIGVVVESNCQYFKSLSFPDIVVACLRVKKLGKTSVTYEIGIFPENETQSICAFGFFVHVFVDRDSRKPVPIPDKILTALQDIVHESPHSS